jgi:hypothetical protein
LAQVLVCDTHVEPDGTEEDWYAVTLAPPGTVCPLKEQEAFPEEAFDEPPLEFPPLDQAPLPPLPALPPPPDESSPPDPQAMASARRASAQDLDPIIVRF